MAVRLRDVAERAGVSVKTASNVINDYPHIKPSTRARVEAAIRELRYRPNESARQLKHGRSGFLALAVPQMDSPYFAELASRLSTEASRLGYILLLDVTGADPDAERTVLDGVRSHVIDGLIFSPLALSADEIAARADELPMVLLGERAVPAGYDHVAVDSVAAARAMTRHLLDLGRRRVAAVGRESFRGTASVRLRGYREALAEAGVPYDPQLVKGVAQYQRSDGWTAMSELLALDDPPDAVFCFNDLMAIGALRACAEAGVVVPEQVAIAGFDDIAEGRFSTPTLTTVAADMDLLVRETMELLLHRVEKTAEPTRRLSVPWRLELRESTVGRSSISTPSSSA
jgi:DNA-binding LacI/PurR family transcriptional regulator